MTRAVEIENAGLSYCDPALAENAARSYGRVWPGDNEQSALSLVRASRFVDGLEFRTDGDAPPLNRWDAGDDVPDRVSHAVCLLAIDLPPDGEPAPADPEVSSVTAGPAGVDFKDSGPASNAVQADDQLLANRLGIPSVAAYRLLRPFLALPEDQSPYSGKGPQAAIGASTSVLANRRSLSA